MNPGSFVKLYGAILDSSVWSEPPAVRLVWITLLVMADEHGHVAASVPGVARRANVSLADALQAIETLESPDVFDRSGQDQGRRVRTVQGGWELVNYERYRDMRTEKQVADAKRKAEWRAANGVDKCDVSQMSHEVSPSPSPSVVLSEQELKENSVVKEHDDRLRPPHDALADFLVRYDWGDYRKDVEGFIRSQRSPISVMGVLKGHIEGIDGKAVDPRVVGRAVQEYAASGEPRFSSQFFAGFVRGIGRKAARTKSHDQTGTEAARIDHEAAAMERSRSEELVTQRMVDRFVQDNGPRYVELLAQAERQVPLTLSGPTRHVMIQAALVTLIRQEVNNQEVNQETNRGGNRASAR